MHRLLYNSRADWPVDPDVASYFQRSDVQSQAVSKLVTDLKVSNLWGKLNNIFPFAGTTAQSQAVNLKSSTRNMTWFGGPLFTQRGVSSGVGKYGEFPADLTINSLSIAIRIQDYSTHTGRDLRNMSDATNLTRLFVRNNNILAQSDLMSVLNGGLVLPTTDIVNVVASRGTTHLHQLQTNGTTRISGPLSTFNGTGLVTWTFGLNCTTSYRILCTGLELSPSEMVTLSQIMETYTILANVE